jgi:predicted transcriptional regulator
MSDQTKEQLSSSDLLRMASEVVAAYVRNNPVPTKDLAGVINTVHNSLADLSNGGPEQPQLRDPAVPVRKSIRPDYIVCLEDGKKLKMLKRHLRTSYGMTPEEYRLKWGLAPDYPMVAPNYAKQRSEFAKKIGLGHSRRRA